MVDLLKKYDLRYLCIEVAAVRPLPLFVRLKSRVDKIDIMLIHEMEVEMGG